VEKGYGLYECQKCKQIKKEDKPNFAPHEYSDDYTCHDRECLIDGCDHVETSTTEHSFTKEYVCEFCKTAKPCTLEIIGQDFSQQILAQARINAGSMTGDFEIVVLDAESTKQNIQNYTTSAFDEDKITKGLFVKFDVTNGGEITLFTIYYNFGLQFSEEQTSDVSFTYDGTETWFLEVVEGNKTILFEYSIT
jgi:hypothetical protein